MWFILSVSALLFWSGSDLFSKIGCQDEKDRYSPLKMLTAVGLVMGIHALAEILFFGTKINFEIIIAYLPVSLLYISSMAIGYLGLRYIELSVSSPICNSSGALVAIISFIFFGFKNVTAFGVLSVLLVVIGVVGIGIVEMLEDEDLREKRQKNANRKYTKSIFAVLIPVLYCLLDAIGTFADNRVLERIPEDSANAAYELTFFTVGVIAFIYTAFVKKKKFTFSAEKPKYIGAIFETFGQFAYIYAIADTKHLYLSAPTISAYCVLSVLWGRIFLKEKLSFSHYLMIGITVLGIVLLGILDI